MTLKDWKKVSINQWRHKNKRQLIRISQNISNTLWRVVIKNDLSGFLFVDNQYKTKPTALKFAMRYMRTH